MEERSTRAHMHLYNTGGTITNDDDPNLDLYQQRKAVRYILFPMMQMVTRFTPWKQEGGVVGPGWKWEDVNEDGMIDR